MTLKQIYQDLWIKEGLICTDDRKELYFQRTLSIPALILGEIAHFVCVFPGNEGDYQLNISGKVIT
jgi:hypothetical protein